MKNYNIKKKTRFFSLKDVLSETAAVYNNNNNLTNKKETRSEAVPYKVKQKNIKKKKREKRLCDGKMKHIHEQTNKQKKKKEDRERTRIYIDFIWVNNNAM